MTYFHHERTYHHLALVIKSRAMYICMTEGPFAMCRPQCNQIIVRQDKCKLCQFRKENSMIYYIICWSKSYSHLYILFSFIASTPSIQGVLIVRTYIVQHSNNVNGACISYTQFYIYQSILVHMYMGGNHKHNFYLKDKIHNS